MRRALDVLICVVVGAAFLVVLWGLVLFLGVAGK